MTTVPTIDQLAANPEAAEALPSHARRDLLARCLSAVAALVVADAPAPAKAAESVLLDIAGAAQLLGMSRRWVEEHLRDLPERVSLCGAPRWKRSDLDRYIASRPAYGVARPRSAKKRAA